MRSHTRESLPLAIPDNCSNKRELFLESLSPVKFKIEFYDESAIEVFDESSAQFLPILPWGYHWEKMDDKYGIYKLAYASKHEIMLVIYGPDENRKINYNLLVDGKNYYTLSHTRNNSQDRLRAKDRNYPDPIKNSASGYRADAMQYMPGHCIDHVDSIIPPKAVVQQYGNSCYSSFNPANYIPEVQKDYWGLYMRKGLVAAQRKNSYSYAQLVEYPDDPYLTSSITAVPESVYFYRLDDQYTPEQVCWIDWDENYNQHKKPPKVSMLEHMGLFSTSNEAAPTPYIWDASCSDRSWRKMVRDKRTLGHNIRKQQAGISSVNPERDQIYAYCDASSLEYLNSYASISAALAASPQKKVSLTKANLKKATQHGEKLLELDEKAQIIDGDRCKWVKRFHEEKKPGFEDDDIVDVVRQLTFSK